MHAIVLDIAYKHYVRSFLDYGDVLYSDQNLFFMAHLESVQYKAGLIVSGCWYGTSRDKLYDELGWESLERRRWYRRLCLFYKVKHHLAPPPPYLHEYIQIKPPSKYPIRKARQVVVPLARTTRYQRSFFPYCISEWNTLDVDITNSSSLEVFQSKLLRFIRPEKRIFYGIRDQQGIAFLTKIRVDFSDLREHRYRHNFNCPDPLCSCLLENETTEHFFLRCPKYVSQRATIIDSVLSILPQMSSAPTSQFCALLLYGSNTLTFDVNKSILTCSIEFIRNTNRFRSFEAFLEC